MNLAKLIKLTLTFFLFIFFTACNDEAPRLTPCEEYTIESSKTFQVWYTIPDKAEQIRTDSQSALANCTESKITEKCNTKCANFNEEERPGCIALCKSEEKSKCEADNNDTKEVTASTLADLYNNTSKEKCGALIVNPDPVRADVKPNSEDTDRDGKNNFEEFLLNTDPCQAESVCPDITIPSPTPKCRAGACKE